MDSVNNLCLIMENLGFGPGVTASSSSPTKLPLSPDHPNPALPITEVNSRPKSIAYF